MQPNKELLEYLNDTHSAELKSQLMDINAEIAQLRDLSNEILIELCKRTTPKYNVGKILQRLNEFGDKKNVKITKAVATAKGWKYTCSQAGVLSGIKTYHIDESLLHDLNLNEKDFYTTSPKNSWHRKPKRQKKGENTPSVKIDAATQDKINALLNI
tara:strand:+ start:1668 stop:2138 length:471 start_codon:yes stop_codon:yes gene_type:complete